MLSILILFSVLCVVTLFYLSWETKNRVPDRPYFYVEEEHSWVGVMEVEIEPSEHDKQPA